MFFIICHLCFHIYAQDTLSIEDKANNYYQELNKKYNEQARLFNLEFLDKYGFPPDPNEFSREFYRKELNKLKDSLSIYTSCWHSSIGFIEERLLIWELMKGGTIPDSTFLILIDAYYKIAPDKAVKFCISRWEFRKYHEIDIVKYHEVPWVKNYPYLVFLFDNLSLIELLNALIMKNNLSVESNKNFIDLCFKELKYNKSEEEMRKIIEYVRAMQAIGHGRQYNDYFIKLLKNN